MGVGLLIDESMVEIVDEDVVLVKVLFDDCLLVCVNGILVCWLGDDCYCDFGYCKDMNPLSVQGLVVC